MSIAEQNTAGVRQRGTVLRSDARRSRAAILAAAKAAFATGGVAVPLTEIARRAGVGTGTLYRHFPSKADLYEAVVHDRVKQLIENTYWLATIEDPGVAFFLFFSEMVQQVSLNKALLDALETGMGLRLQATPGLQQEFRAAVGVLLARAQRTGQVRADVDVADAVALAMGCIAMEHHRGSTGRMIALACDALRPGRAAEDLGKTQQLLLSSLRRGSTGQRSGTDHSPGLTTCEVCRKTIAVRPTGRPARFCGPACRQRAHRKRTRTGGEQTD